MCSVQCADLESLHVDDLQELVISKHLVAIEFKKVNFRQSEFDAMCALSKLVPRLKRVTFIDWDPLNYEVIRLSNLANFTPLKTFRVAGNSGTPNIQLHHPCLLSASWM